MTDEFSASWTDPEYVAAVVGVLAVGALVFYSVLVEGAPPVETVLFVLLWVTVPVTVAYGIARQMG